MKVTINVNCLFCKIINNKVDVMKIYENDYVISFLDINPVSEGHCLVITKQHFDNLSKADDLYLSELIKAKKYIANILYKKLKCLGINYLSNENCIAGQTIIHLHYHIIPKYNKEKGFIINQKINKNIKLNDIYKKIGMIN